MAPSPWPGSFPAARRRPSRTRPYAKPRFTDTTPTTFAGILAYTEHTFGLGALGPNDRYAYPFSNAFNYQQVPLKPARMVQRPLPAAAKHIHLSNQLLNDPT